ALAGVAQLLVGVVRRGHRAPGEAVEVPPHLHHGPVHRVVHVQAVGQLYGAGPPARSAGPRQDAEQQGRGPGSHSFHGHHPFLSSAIVPMASRTLASRAPKSRFSNSSPEISCEPIPTHTAPAENQAPRLSRVGDTPPVGITSVQGWGPLIALTNPGP